LLEVGIAFSLEDEDTRQLVELLMAAGADSSIARVGDALMAEPHPTMSSGYEINHADRLAQLLGR
jgi:hypothetical protein